MFRSSEKQISVAYVTHEMLSDLKRGCKPVAGRRKVLLSQGRVVGHDVPVTRQRSALTLGTADFERRVGHSAINEVDTLKKDPRLFCSAAKSIHLSKGSKSLLARSISEVRSQFCLCCLIIQNLQKHALRVFQPDLAPSDIIAVEWFVFVSLSIFVHHVN
jgi:hypothetical protein